MKVVIVGKHGGANKSNKLKASTHRIQLLTEIIERFNPNLVITCCSPEAARISYGIGIKHIAFTDSPHAEAVMRLCLPFVQKLFTPWIIPKKEFVRFGISEKDIIQYKAIDAAAIVKQKSKKCQKSDFKLKDKKTIVIRIEESEAAYVLGKKNSSLDIIREIVKRNSNHNIVVLARYFAHVKILKKEFGNEIIVFNNVINGKGLLEFTDVFIGSGGTMTAEAALMGIPTISYEGVPNIIEKYLVRIGLIKREKIPSRIVDHIGHILKSNNTRVKKKAGTLMSSMEDPFSKLLIAIKSAS